jgi:hypothetical protein
VGPEREGDVRVEGSGELVGAMEGLVVVAPVVEEEEEEEEGDPPMVAFSEMMLLVPMWRGCVVVVKRERGWMRLCSPKTIGWVPRMYAPGSRCDVGGRVTGGRFDADEEDVAFVFGFDAAIALCLPCGVGGISRGKGAEEGVHTRAEVDWLGGAGFALRRASTRDSQTHWTPILLHIAVMSYYDVDTILNENFKAPSTFQIDVPGLGYIDGSPGETVGLNRF